jgi:predicted regulator of Ras-like GTPase activity (Roadblock/LC7/MglB family)
MSNMNETLNTLLNVDGAEAVAVVDHSSGMLLGSTGSGVDLEIAAAGNTEVVRAKLKTMEMLKLDEDIDDILITLTGHYHLIRPMSTDRNLFLYYVLSSSKANLALARRALRVAEESLKL